jgi:hypothetical protein
MLKCDTALDTRVDSELIGLCQRATQLLPEFFTRFRMQLDSDGVPANASELWLAYTAALAYGAADALLLCVLHNRGREAIIVERQIVEYFFRAKYYAEHPEEARFEFLAWPLRDKKFLDDIGLETGSERYRAAEDACDLVQKKFPDAYRYAEAKRGRERDFASMYGDMNEASVRAEYAFKIRRTSQTLHASVVGMQDVLDFSSDGVIGIKFDSRSDDPNFCIESATIHLIEFLNIINATLALTREADVLALQQRMDAILARRHPRSTQEASSHKDS